MIETQRYPPAENRDEQSSLKLRWCDKRAKEEKAITNPCSDVEERRFQRRVRFHKFKRLQPQW